MNKARYLLTSLWMYYLQTGRWRKAGLLALGTLLVLCSCMGAFSLLLTQESPALEEIPAERSSPTSAPDALSTRYSIRLVPATPTLEPDTILKATSSPVPSVTAVPAAPLPPVTGTRAVVRIIDIDRGAEFVDIRNEGLRSQDLSGWVLVSDGGQQECPLDGVLRAGETLRVWSMAEDLGNGGYNCGLDDPIWHNLGTGAAVLYNAAGEEVDRVHSRP